MDRGEKLYLFWEEPKSKRRSFAGRANYDESLLEYVLEILEEPLEKKYFLKPYKFNKSKIYYRLELETSGFGNGNLKRIKVGSGHSFKNTRGSSNIYIHYGSKCKRLVLVDRSEDK